MKPHLVVIIEDFGRVELFRDGCYRFWPEPHAAAKLATLLYDGIINNGQLAKIAAAMREMALNRAREICATEFS